MMIVIFFIVIAAVNALNFHAVLESVDAECPKPCPECEWATLLLDGVHKLHATIDKVSKFLFYYNNITFKRFLFLFWFVIFIIGSFFFSSWRHKKWGGEERTAASKTRCMGTLRRWPRFCRDLHL